MREQSVSVSIIKGVNFQKPDKKPIKTTKSLPNKCVMMTEPASWIIILFLILIIFLLLKNFHFFVSFLEGDHGENQKIMPDNDTAKTPAPTEKKLEYEHTIQDTETKKNIAVFLSYRRNDSADVSGRIYDRLSIKYGKENIFKDVDSIPLGFDFRSYIDEMVSRAEIFLAVIGPDWFGGDAQDRRIDDPRDFVRLEIQSALDRKIPVIPLLVRDASMPSEHDLPDDIKGLSFRNGIPVRPDPDFENDITRLLSGLNRLSSKVQSPDL